MIIIFELLLAACALFYIFVKRKQTYWKRLGVPYVEPEFFFGNTRGIDKTNHHSDLWKSHYFKLKDKGPIVGYYLYTEPIAMLTDPELMKRIFVKDFDYFCNRGFYLNEKYDPATATILAVENERWRNLRNRVSALFVTGRQKKYFTTIMDTTDLFLERIEVEGNPELRVFASRFVTDVLGRIFLTTEFNQLKEGKHDMGPIVSGTVRGITYTSKCMAEIYRWLLADILKLKFFPKFVAEYMGGLIKNIIKERESSLEKKTDDAIDLLYSFHKCDENPITLDEVWTNSSAFVIAGHDNLTSVIRHTLYELAKNFEAQKYCRDSIKEVMKKHNINSQKNITYEALSDMTFVEQCIHETIRIYIAPIFTGRMTKYDYKVPGTNITLEKGTLVHSAIYGVHNDPEYFPNPEIWDPHRMHPSNTENRQKLAFIPFGMGPHQCIGSRVALIVAKTSIARTVLTYEMELNRDKTTEKLKFNPRIFSITTEDVQGIYLKFNKIKEEE